VTPEQGERLGLAATEGKVLLALRNPSDTSEVVTKGVTVPVLLASLGAPAPLQRSGSVSAKPAVRPTVKTAAAVNAAKPTFMVQGIRGTAVSEYKFERGE
jgi:pilus assembly protein CpaB